jgi:hypothetical protein
MPGGSARATPGPAARTGSLGSCGGLARVARTGTAGAARIRAPASIFKRLLALRVGARIRAIRHKVRASVPAARIRAFNRQTGRQPAIWNDAGPARLPHDRGKPCSSAPASVRHPEVGLVPPGEVTEAVRAHFPAGGLPALCPARRCRLAVGVWRCKGRSRARTPVQWRPGPQAERRGRGAAAAARGLL